MPCIPDWRNAPSDLNGVRLPVAVSDLQRLAPEHTGEDGLSDQSSSERPANDLSRKNIQHYREIDKYAAQADVGYVGGPQLGWSRSVSMTVRL